MEEIKDEYYVSEYFQSIQGEGNYSGVNSLFIRFHFCNLTCTWCDTKYTWLAGSGKFQPYTAEQIKEMISLHPTRHIIFTGGEPTLYRLDKLVVDGKKNHVESNGTFIPTQPLDIILSDQSHLIRDAMDESVIQNFNWVISPKLSNAHQLLNEESISFWSHKEYCIFKLIVRNEADLDEIEIFLKKYGINREKVYIGLEGQSLDSQLQPALVDNIVKRGYNFSPRLHVILWGAKRRK